jgi:hypothetical protein
MKTYWLSFCAEDTGQNIGVCVVEVSDEQAAEAVQIAKAANPGGVYPDGHEWIVAAIGQSLLMECNPGGHVEATEVDPSTLPAALPRNRLVQKDELQRIRMSLKR